MFHQTRNDERPETVGEGMRAARSLEIVVLFDPTLGGGLWTDVDPSRGRPAAALAYQLTNTDGQTGIHVRRIVTPRGDNACCPLP